MILSRRQAHLYIFTALVVVLPLTFVVATILRPQYGPLAADAESLFTTNGFNLDEDAIADSETLKGKGISLDVAALAAEGEQWLVVQPSKILKRPDLLLYWQAGSDAPEELGEDAVLLGALSGRSQRRFPLPESMQGEAGQLVIYSHGGQVIVTTMELPAALTK
ncbi:MAG: hypothetical protein F6J87_13170 [Spirulina sp. SIO3F2]|nr:hypothetical protein [Spirulina sp. SIO3F2]